VITPAYITGARPVVGTLAASGLMLLACSWFVLAPVDLGGTRDIGAPSPVRMFGGGTLEQRPAHRPAATVAHARRSGPGTVEPQHQAAAARRAAAPNRARTREPILVSAQPPATGPAAQPPAVTPSPSPAPAPATQQPAVTPTPPAAAAAGDLPQVTLPPVSIPSPPDVAAPDIAATTIPLGLP
jgi:hypothetical protein